MKLGNYLRESFFTKVGKHLRKRFFDNWDGSIFQSFTQDAIKIFHDWISSENAWVEKIIGCVLGIILGVIASMVLYSAVDKIPEYQKSEEQSVDVQATLNQLLDAENNVTEAELTVENEDFIINAGYDRVRNFEIVLNTIKDKISSFLNFYLITAIVVGIFVFFAVYKLFPPVISFFEFVTYAIYLLVTFIKSKLKKSY